MNITTKVKKLFGHRYDNRYTWGELTIKKKCTFMGNWLGLTYNKDIVHGGKALSIHVPFIDLYIDINKKDIEYFDDDAYRSYGIYFYDNCELVFRLGKWGKTIYLPWMYEWQKTEILTQDMKTVVWIEKKGNRWDNWEEKTKIKDSVSETRPYKYTLNSGEIQERKAKYHVERWVWGWRWFPWKRMVRTTIEIEFDKEVGERTGSWKGGCVGCSYEINQGETPEQTLKRMEAERKFK